MHLSESRLGNLTIHKRWLVLTDGCDPVALEKFLTFHNANLHVYDALETRALSQYAEGWKKSSVWLLLNMERWSPSSTFDISSDFKVNNNYFAFYTRLLLANHPKLINWLEIKLMKGQNCVSVGMVYR
jgi:hypothetical protein